MLLFELLNSPGKLKYLPSGGHEYKAALELPGGRRIIYHLHNTERSDDPEIWELEFSDDSETDFSKRVGVTGSGDELAIFSTAIDFAANFFQIYPNNIITFSSEEANRTSLYQRMVKRKLPPEYEVKAKQYGTGEGQFYIGKPESLAAAEYNVRFN